MPFCPSCGTAVEGKFCAKCGAAVSGSTPSGSPAAPPPVPPGGAAAGAGLPENTASALCYLVGLITGILFLVLAPYNQNKTVRFHAFQSIFLHVAAIIVAIGINIVFAILRGILGFWLIATLSPIVWLGFLILWILMMVWAYQGKKVVLPVIGPLAQQQA